MLALYLWWGWWVCNHVWLVVGAIAVAIRWLGVVVGVVMVIGGIVAGEGLVLLRMLLRGDAVVYWHVLVWGGCGGGLSPCVVNRFWWA